MKPLDPSFVMETHEAFIFDELLPLIVTYAASNHHPTEAAALASFLALATVLQSKGIDRQALMCAIDQARLPTHQSSETIQ